MKLIRGDNMFFVLSVLLALTPWSSADTFVGSAPSCKNIFQLNFGFNPRFPHSNKYDVEVKEESAVKDQCNFGHCHLYTWMSELEVRHNIKISTEYLDMQFLRSESLKALMEGDLSLAQGGHALSTRLAFRSTGIIPAEAWHGKTNFNKRPQSGQLIEAIENIVARAVLYRSQVFEEKDIETINKSAYEQINALIDNYAGKVPQQFMFRGKTYDPHLFAQTFFPELLLPLIKVEHNRKDNEFWELSQTQSFSSYKGSLELMESLGRKVIDSGRPFYISYTHSDAFVDRKSGIMSIRAFDYPVMSYPMKPSNKALLNQHNGGHAVLVVGYEAHPETGRVLKWKIKNSWGDKSGDGGYFHMYRDYFEKFVSYIAFANDGSVPLPPAKQPARQLELPF